MASRNSQHHYGPPPIHDPRAQQQHHHHQPPPAQPPPPPAPPQYSHHPPGPHYQGPPPPPPQPAPPYHSQPYQQPPPHPQAQGPPPHSQPPYPAPTYPGATQLPPQGQTLPPIQPTAHPPPTTSSEQTNLPSFRHPSAPPSHEQREVGPEYHSQYPHPRSGHATPAPVSRTYSHDSGHQRSPATPIGPGAASFPPSVGQDGAPPPPGHPPQQMDHGHHGYPPVNGVPHGLPPPHHQMGPMVDQHAYPHYPPPGQSMYPGPSYGPATGTMYGTKRKQMRATQACEQCRQRKQKCDEGTPCSFCKENNLTCNYRDTPPVKTDKNMEKLLNYMESHSAGLLEIMQMVKGFDARLRRVEHDANHRQNHTRAGAETEPETEPEIFRSDEPSVITHHNRKSELEDHRTAPHKLLLLWPSVKPLLKASGVNLNDSYVVEAEDRGVLRLWTRGEGIDEYDGTQPGGGPGSPAHSDESGEVATPHADGIWGTGFPSTPGSESRRSEPYGAGGLKANGEVDLDASTINALYESYMRHLHILHPFLDKRRLRRMFDSFIRKYSTGRPRATFAVGQQLDSDQRPLKRQRSNGSSANLGSDNDLRKEPTERSPGNAIVYLVMALGKICLHKEPLPAIVPDSKLANVSVNVLRGDTAASRAWAADSPVSANMKPSPTSPNPTPTTQPTPPSEAALRMYDSRSRRSSVEGSSPSSIAGARNLDVIPGIAYYAKAAEILGDQGDGNDLVHAQMFLLAGLYKGQLARVKESMSWITMAGRAVQSLLDRYKLYNQHYWESFGDVKVRHSTAQARIKDTRQSLIVLASWTCLQLESDILAELKLPSSNIQSIENLLIMPNKVPEHIEEESYEALQQDGRPEDDERILLFYTAQLYIRRRLNQMHNEMYGRDSLDKSLAEVQSMLQGHEQVLNSWREALPEELQWKDSDPPPKDILSARLRAKYWGAKYITNRPFLDFALHIMEHVHAGRSVESVAQDGDGNRRDKADIHLFKAIQQMGDSHVWNGVERCVEAAMQSTVAFDGIEGRVIVTNIHGTAHAQFGNMLVLAATHQHNSLMFLKRVVNTEKFQRLLERTIKFLRRLAPISPTCALDCGILEKFNHTIFPPASEHPMVYKNEKVAPMSASNSFYADS